jgi:Protein of unknown function (DUF1778)
MQPDPAKTQRLKYRESPEDGALVRLSAEDQTRFVESLLHPKAPTPAMQRAHEHRARLFGEKLEGIHRQALEGHPMPTPPRS